MRAAEVVFSKQQVIRAARTALASEQQRLTKMAAILSSAKAESDHRSKQLQASISQQSELRDEVETLREARLEILENMQAQGQRLKHAEASIEQQGLALTELHMCVEHQHMPVAADQLVAPGPAALSPMQDSSAKNPVEGQECCPIEIETATAVEPVTSIGQITEGGTKQRCLELPSDPEQLPDATLHAMSSTAYDDTIAVAPSCASDLEYPGASTRSILPVV